MLLGLHVSTAGSIYESLNRANALGCNTMQIFARPPQQWRQGTIKKEDVAEFNKRRLELKIKPVFIHISYLINLASPNPRLYKASIKAYIEDIEEAQGLGADYIVTHMGSHKETSEEAGLRRLTKALNEITAQTRGSKVGILLENTAGSGSWLGYKFVHQKMVYDGINYKDRVGFCLDTAHAYLAGYDLASKDGLQYMLNEINSLVGLDPIKLIHLNDAFGKLGSHHDRHENIGKGNIGLEGMRRLINHPDLKNKAFILETPKREEGDDVKNLKVVRKLRKN